MRFSVLVASFILSTSLTLPLALPAFAKGAEGRVSSQSETGSFRFHVPSEPRSLDPRFIQSTDANYFLNNISRGLYTFSQDKGLMPEGAKACRFQTQLKLVCDLAKIKWSDGSRIVAADYVRAFQRLVGPESKNPAVELLKNVSSFRAQNESTLIFEFSKPDPEFLFKLTSSVLVPIKSENFPALEDSAKAIVNGPYKVSKWIRGRRVFLEPNRHYQGGRADRPPVEVLFVEDDQTALHLYEQGELNFLRRLPTTEIPKSKSRPDFFQVPMARFDYIGFGPELRDEPALREALSYALDFQELAKIYDALGIPGCPSLPREFMQNEPCIRFDLERAKRALARVAPEKRAIRLQLMFSKLGGDDIKKGAEWLQGQWKKHLGLRVDLLPTEQGVFLASLREAPPSIFRKGVPIERPTCLAALETFAKGGAENFVKFDDPEYEKVLSKMDKTTNSKALCSDGIEILLNQNRLIPLGRIHFTLLARPEFTGWKLNQMNQLDLSGLTRARKVAADTKSVVREKE